MKILVCDDESSVRKVLVVMLGIDHHQVETAVDGQEALEKIQANSFDVLITDLKMPKLSGLELVGRLRDEKNPLKIIMITGYWDEMDKSQLDRLELNGFLTKPFKTAELLECLNALGS